MSNTALVSRIALPSDPMEVRKRSLAGMVAKLLVAVPMRDPVDGVPKNLVGLGKPEPTEMHILKVACNDSGDGRNTIAQYALDHGFKYVIMVDDDVFPPEPALIRLMQLVRGGKKVIAAAHVNKRIDGLDVPESVNWVKQNGEAVPVQADGKVHEAVMLGTGCIAIPVQAFRDIRGPWFSWAGGLSDDVHFSQLAREAGYQLQVDTGIHAKHIDRKTGAEF